MWDLVTRTTSHYDHSRVNVKKNGVDWSMELESDISEGGGHLTIEIVEFTHKIL